MKLTELLSRIQLIQPDQAFSETSKRAVLATLPGPVRQPLRGRVLFWRIFETAIAGGLGAVVVFVLVTGGFSGGGAAPVPFAAINPNTLHAEAQAIDMQIQLASLVYQESTTTADSTTSAVMTHPSVMSAAAVRVAPATSTVAGTGTGTGTGTTTPSSSVSVDYALSALSE